MNCMKIKRRTAGAVMAALLIGTLCGCSGNTIHSTDFSAADTYSVPAGGYLNDLDPSLDLSTVAAAPEQLAALEGLPILCQTEEAVLYQGIAYDIILLDKRTGSLLYSNPGVYTDKPFTNDEIKFSHSQVLIQYYNNDGVLVQATSYPECYNGDDKNQVKVEKTDAGASVTYQFGESEDAVRIYYSGMRVETFEALEKDSAELIGQKAITKTDWQRFKGLYKLLEWEKLTQAEKTKYAALYPNLESLGKIYAMEDNITAVQLKVMEKVAKAAGVTVERVEEENQALGGSDAVVTTAPSFRVTLCYALDGADLIVWVDKSEIQESVNGRIAKVIILPELMSASGTGYSFLPDGSGALIDHTVQGSSTGEYELPFYGIDYALAQKTVSDSQVSALFPVAGIRNGERGIFAIAEAGAATAGVTASPSSTVRDHNAVYLWFTTRAIDSRSDGTDVKRENQTIFTQPEGTGVFAVRYHQLYGENADYNGMARYYRAYLERTGVLNADKKDTAHLLDVEMLGGIRTAQLRFGIPVKTGVALSSYAQIGAWMDTMHAAGVQAMDVSLTGWHNGGIEQGILGEIKAEKSLGSLDELSALCDTAREYGYTLFPSADLLLVASDGYGLKQSSHLAQMINQDFAHYYVYTPATQNPNKQFDIYLLNPLYLESRTGMFISNYRKIADTVLVASAGDKLYGSYEEGNLLNRDRSAQLVGDALKKMKAEGLTLKISGGNQYALPYADRITNLPVINSSNRLFSASVPFAGLVLHGYVAYSGSLLNTASDYQTALLRCVETGAAFRFQLMLDDPLLLAQTKFHDYYAAFAAEWQEKIIAVYDRFSALYDSIAGVRMQSHQQLGDDLVRVEYENGDIVYINYGTQAAVADGQSVEAMDFLWKKGE